MTSPAPFLRSKRQRADEAARIAQYVRGTWISGAIALELSDLPIPKIDTIDLVRVTRISPPPPSITRGWLVRCCRVQNPTPPGSTTEIDTPSAGKVTVATPAHAAFHLARRVNKSGGWQRAHPILAATHGHIDPFDLLTAARHCNEFAPARRIFLAWLTKNNPNDLVLSTVNPIWDEIRPTLAQMPRFDTACVIPSSKRTGAWEDRLGLTRNDAGKFDQP